VLAIFLYLWALLLLLAHYPSMLMAVQHSWMTRQFTGLNMIKASGGRQSLITSRPSGLKTFNLTELPGSSYTTVQGPTLLWKNLSKNFYSTLSFSWCVVVEDWLLFIYPRIEKILVGFSLWVLVYYTIFAFSITPPSNTSI